MLLWASASILSTPERQLTCNIINNNKALPPQHHNNQLSLEIVYHPLLVVLLRHTATQFLQIFRIRISLECTNSQQANRGVSCRTHKVCVYCLSEACCMCIAGVQDIDCRGTVYIDCRDSMYILQGLVPTYRQAVYI